MSTVYVTLIFIGSLAFIGLGTLIVWRVGELPVFARALLFVFCMIKGALRGVGALLVLASGTFEVSSNVSGIALFITVSDAVILWTLLIGLTYHYYIRPLKRSRTR